MAAPRVVTLTTDIGSAYAAQLKAVLLERLPPGHLVDIAHDLAAHRIEEAAFLLAHIGPAFPAGTVHLAVVDPGVGSARAPVALACRDGSLLVGPDNGVLAPLARRLGGARAVRLDPARLGRRGRVSATFEGRDLFAPAAALLATGVPLERLGPPWRYRRLALPRPRRSASRLVGSILHVDHFANAITNLPTEWSPRVGRDVEVRLGPVLCRLARRRTYAELAPGEAGLLGSSFGTLEVAVREGRAAELLGLRVGLEVEVLRRPRSPRTARVSPSRARRASRRREYGK